MPESAPDSRLALVRYSGDISTKAPATRHRFVTRLARNLKDALRSEGARGRVERTHNRLFIHLEDARLPSSLERVFGVQSVSLVAEQPLTTLEAVVREGVARFSHAVRGRRFAVRARRVGERSRHTIDSREVERTLGAELLPLSAGVDLGQPEVTAHIELMPGRVCFFHDTRRGRAGLPLGVEGRAVALVSGGFDSAVAAWMMQKRGVALDYVFCNLGGDEHQLGTLRVMKHVADAWSYGSRPHFHAIDFDAVSRDLQQRCATRYWQIVLKRSMLRAAESVARDRGAFAIVTGEAIGQVSSQTLQNIAAISEATSVPILRPLVGMNKEEILEIARSIGTFELSKTVPEYCALVPSKPATSAALAAVQAEDAKLDPVLLERATAERTLLDLRTLDLTQARDPELQVESIEEGTTLIDLRSKAAYQSWHYPGALFLDFASAMRTFASFDRDQRYVLYCEVGLKSAHLAQRMRAEGLHASHFAGGLRKLAAYAREQGLPTPDGR